MEDRISNRKQCLNIIMIEPILKAPHGSGCRVARVQGVKLSVGSSVYFPRGGVLRVDISGFRVWTDGS